MIGFLLGPMAPIAANHTARVLPRHLVNGTVGWMAASKKRRLLAMIIILGLVWAFVPRGRKMILADFEKKAFLNEVTA